ncbi:carboxyl transferase domain-containing protein [Pseudomaricurvus sp.]|uniref:acetyl-CoA carboxylase family protein n=1 Tax=Pseudomaricurvus sp. TaxID=2004510 RepID=UPI003F6B7223
MAIQRLMIANRGEIAIRIARAAAELQITSVALYSEDDQPALHPRKADEAIALQGTGVSAYLDIPQIIELAKQHRCDAIHPGYGFLSENRDFAAACEANDLTFVGPTPETLDAFGNKASARELAIRCDVPLLNGTQNAATLEDAHAFYTKLLETNPAAAIMIKAIAGGGGRGMRAVHHPDELEEEFKRCQSEALAAFGQADVYLEQKVVNARHIEIQILGDGQGQVSHFGERECSLQRRHQKLIEIAPSPSVSEDLRESLCAAAVTLAGALNYRGLGTFEFLVDCDTQQFFFMEANPRVQVEHTVTESVYNVDLVQAQLQVASGKSLSELNLTQADIRSPQGYALQARINTETIDSSGNITPAGGEITRFELASGPGIRIDSCGFNGFRSSPYYDSLLAKLIVHSASPEFSNVIRKAERSLRECSIDGIDTNVPLLHALLTHPDVANNQINTQYIDQHIHDLITAASPWQALYTESNQVAAHASRQEQTAPEHWSGITAPMQAVVVEVSVSEGDTVLAGQAVAVVEAMKMEHVITAQVSGIVQRIEFQTGDAVSKDESLMYLEVDHDNAGLTTEENHINLELIRPDLQEFFDRRAKTGDSARPQAMEKRHNKGMRSARENITDLVDEGSFQEYGSLTIAAQRRRRSIEELIDVSPADGLITGTASINGDQFSEDKSRCLVMSYDYTVFAGTQGVMNHKKTDRMFRLANQQKMPLVFFTEGGGGRPGDTDYPVVAGLDLDTWSSLATLSGQAPIVGITAGRCFAGNAAILGCSDVIIATQNSNIGMAGPAMIEGGGLGVFDASEVGPSDVHSANGVIDILVEDETEAVAAAKKYLSYFQGCVQSWEADDSRKLRHLIPENRLRSYDIRAIIESLADVDSVLELRAGFGSGMITSLIRIEGRPFGLIANNSRHLGGAIDTPAADKATRFMKLCDAFDLPLISLCDTPGFMVGPEAEKSAQVRHFSRMFVTAANMEIPLFNIVLRKGYGLGAMAMTGGNFHAGVFTVSWPTGEFGAMGLEGAVRLGFKKELEALEDLDERNALFDKLVAKSYEKGKAINMASTLELDEVIDPADSRRWIIRGLKSSAPAKPRSGKKLRYIDTW